MPGDRNSILCSHIVRFTFAWGYCIGYHLRHFKFYFSAQPFPGFLSLVLNLQEKFEFHNGLKVIWCCLCTPGKSGEAHPHLVASLAQPFLIKFKLHCCLHFFKKYFS